MVNLSYYELLEVSQNFTLKELKFSYKKLAKIHHPDTKNDFNKSDETFKLISTAYQILLCPIKKAKYDREQGSSLFSKFTSFKSDIHSNTASDMFDNSMKINDKNLEVINVRLTFKESYFGSLKNIKYLKKALCSYCDGTGSKDKKLRTCPKCNGMGTKSIKSGFLKSEVFCDYCDGTGSISLMPCDACDGHKYTMKKTSVELNIPNGLSDGDKLNVTIDELNSFNLKLHIKNNTDFIKQEENLFKQIDLSLTKAILGTNLNIILFDKKINVVIPKNTKHKDLIILKEKGFPSINSKSSYGNIVLEINIIYPVLNEENVKLLYNLDIVS